MIRGVIQYRGGPPELKRQFPRLAGEAFTEVGEHWHRHMLPRHFERAAHAKYGYQPRSVGWIRYKLKRTGQALDNVFTGAMRAMVLAMHRVRGNSKGVSVTLRGPRWLYAYRKDYKQPDKAAEITKVTREELEELAGVMDRSLVARIRALSAVETRSMAS